MTLMTATYELQERLKPEHFRSLGEFSNTYGLQNFAMTRKKISSILTTTHRA
jgi:hypothetical protein